MLTILFIFENVFGTTLYMKTDDEFNTGYAFSYWTQNVGLIRYEEYDINNSLLKNINLIEYEINNYYIF